MVYLIYTDVNSAGEAWTLVEAEGHTGYLMSEFITVLTNEDSDAYNNAQPIPAHIYTYEEVFPTPAAEPEPAAEPVPAAEPEPAAEPAPLLPQLNRNLPRSLRLPLNRNPSQSLLLLLNRNPQPSLLPQPSLYLPLNPNPQLSLPPPLSRNL